MITKTLAIRTLISRQEIKRDFSRESNRTNRKGPKIGTFWRIHQWMAHLGKSMANLKLDKYSLTYCKCRTYLYILSVLHLLVCRTSNSYFSPLFLIINRLLRIKDKHSKKTSNTEDRNPKKQTEECNWDKTGLFRKKRMA